MAMDGWDVKPLVAILLIGAVVLAGWYLRDKLLPQPEPAIVAPDLPVTSEAEQVADPRHPITPVETEAAVEQVLIPLPPLDDSDGYFLLELAAIFGADIEGLLAKEALIDKFVATIDNLPRSHVAEKIRPVGRLSEQFIADFGENGASIYLSPDNFSRYDQLVNRFASADADAIVEMYRRYYPLFQQSYERLGYPNAYFNDRVVEVIDHLLATPRPEEPIRLVRPHVLYEFDDPDLEALSSGQKLMLRLGGDHAGAVKRVLGDLRVELARQ